MSENMSENKELYFGFTGDGIEEIGWFEDFDDAAIYADETTTTNPYFYIGTKEHFESVMEYMDKDLGGKLAAGKECARYILEDESETDNFIEFVNEGNDPSKHILSDVYKALGQSYILEDLIDEYCK